MNAPKESTGGCCPPPPCSALDASWKSINPILRGAMDYGDFKAGWEAAMKSIWERLPMLAYGSDPMTPREVEKLLAYVKSNLPNLNSMAEAAGIYYHLWRPEEIGITKADGQAGTATQDNLINLMLLKSNGLIDAMKAPTPAPRDRE